MTDIGGHTKNPDDGTAYDGEVSVGRVVKNQGTYPEPGLWSWSMTGCAPGRDFRLCAGMEPSREAAKASTEAAYHRLLAVEPGNRERILEHGAAVTERAAMWARRGMATG